MYSTTSEALLRELQVPRRNHFFYGKRMDVQHFEMEQSYGKLKQWMLNRLTLGKGVLCGLAVSVDGNRVCVDPGVAIDGYGREIIVPIRSCIDPTAVDTDCCGNHRPSTETTPARGESASEPPKEALFTIWLCYRECFADQQPTLISDCNTRGHCAPGTVVESFCLKSTAGLPPLQGDPDWCALLWKKASPHAGGENTQPANTDTPPSRMATHMPVSSAGSLPGVSQDQLQTIRGALDSRRHALCELFDGPCASEEEACVPLAVVLVRDGRLFVESCLVRPRIYSNAKLLDLILCLAEKIDACCGQHTPVDLMRVAAVEFLNINSDGVQTSVTTMQTPLQDTTVDITRNPNAIRIRFTKPFAQDQRVPTTHGSNDADFKIHNVQIIPDTPLNGLAYVPGKLTFESADTLRFDLEPQTPYVRSGRGWQKGRYKIYLRGTEQTANHYQALGDLDHHELDGEASAPANGALSGDGTEGGDFIAYFVVGGTAQPQETLRVVGLDFLERTAGAPERVLASVRSPRERTEIAKGFDAIRVRFNRPFAQDQAHQPTIAGLGDAAYAKHNVQLRLSREDAARRGVEYVPCTLAIEAADTFRIDVVRGSRVVSPNGVWPQGSSTYSLYLRGSVGAEGADAPLFDLIDRALDGEPIDPANGVISGDGTPGGDFLAVFTVSTAQ
jgi:hypothetical protein